MNFYQRGPDKYILLKDIKLNFLWDMKVIRRGEIFDGYPCLRETGAFIALDLPDALEYRNMDHPNFLCPIEAVERITEANAEYLVRIVSIEDRYRAFKDLNRLDQPPKAGTKVFVAVNGRELPGIVRDVLPSAMSCVVQVEIQECSMQAKPTMSPQWPFGLVSCVNVPLSKLRHCKTNEEQEWYIGRSLPYRIGYVENDVIPSLFNTELLPVAVVDESDKSELWTWPKSAYKPILQRYHSELEALRKSEQRVDEAEQRFQTCKIEERELRKSLERAQKAKEKAEKEIQTLKRENQELGESLTSAQKAKEEAEKKVEEYEEQLEELQTTLAEAQRLLKEKPKTQSECEWILSRDEIHLTEEKLGNGSFGTVFKGIFRGTQVAVKQVSVKPKITDYNMKNFRREMRMAARCRHPCMLQFIGATSDDQSPLLVTELMDTSLKEVLLERELNKMEIKTIALDVAKGLNYLHLTQPDPIVHRDISSGNVLLWQHGQSWRGKLSDYGNAVLMNYARTGSGGALSYLAPEIDNKRCSTKSDVYSFGVLLLELCLRDEPSSQDDRDRLVCKVEGGAMRQLIRRCVKPDPTQRPSMEDVLADLELIEGNDVEGGDIFQVDTK